MMGEDSTQQMGVIGIWAPKIYARTFDQNNNNNTGTQPFDWSVLDPTPHTRGCHNNNNTLDDGTRLSDGATSIFSAAKLCTQVSSRRYVKAISFNNKRQIDVKDNNKQHRVLAWKSQQYYIISLSTQVVASSLDFSAIDFRSCARSWAIGLLSYHGQVGIIVDHSVSLSCKNTVTSRLPIRYPSQSKS